MLRQVFYTCAVGTRLAAASCWDREALMEAESDLRGPALFAARDWAAALEGSALAPDAALVLVVTAGCFARSGCALARAAHLHVLGGCPPAGEATRLFLQGRWAASRQAVQLQALLAFAVSAPPQTAKGQPAILRW